MKLINSDTNKEINFSRIEEISSFIEEVLLSTMEENPDWWESRGDPISDICSSFYIEGDECSLGDSRSQLVNDIRTSFSESIDF
jgi:hypothetical protein